MPSRMPLRGPFAAIEVGSGHFGAFGMAVTRRTVKLIVSQLLVDDLSGVLARPKFAHAWRS
jgi:hypothetical protein